MKIQVKLSEDTVGMVSQQRGRGRNKGGYRDDYRNIGAGRADLTKNSSDYATVLLAKDYGRSLSIHILQGLLVSSQLYTLEHLPFCPFQI